MTAMIESNPTYGCDTAVRTIDIAGAAWPVYKLQAVVVAVVVGIASLALFTPEITAWLSATALVVTWLVARQLPGNAATARGSNPPGIS